LGNPPLSLLSLLCIFSDILILFDQIFLYYYIIKAPPRLTLYRLKDKKGVGRLTSPYHLKSYAAYEAGPSILKEVVV
jgi:hypothetical protein